MNIKKWHVGKIVILWAWGMVAVAMCFDRLRATANFVPGLLLIAAIFGLPIALSVITWKWFSGKEQ